MMSGAPLTRVYVIRHGEADPAMRGRCCGRMDPRLSPQGSLQMKTAAAMLKEVDLRAVYASPSHRAVESALFLAPKGDLRIESGFLEINFGRLEGLSYEEAASRFPDVYRTWMKQPHLAAFPDGESFTSMRSRVVTAWKKLLRRHVGSTVVVVAHAGVNRVVLAEALRLRGRHLFRLGQDYGAVSLIEYRGRSSIVRLLNVSQAAFDAPSC